MAKTEVIAGLDMGSGRATCLIGTLDPHRQVLKVLGGASVPCRGLKGGVVVNIHEASMAVTKAVEEAEASAGNNTTITALYMGVRGGHLQAFNNRGAFNIARTDREITAEDVNSVVSSAKAIPLSTDRQILHVVPQGFSLDRQRGVPDPVGMEANLLEVEVHIVTGSPAHLSNLTKAVNHAGFQVIEPVYGLLALGELLVTPEEKDLGSVLIDIGGQSLSIGVYYEGSVRYTKEFSIGSDFITRDLAMGLGTTLVTAERIKMEHGFAHPSMLNGDKDIHFVAIDGRSERVVKTSTMMGFILPRVEEIFSLVADDLRASSFADLVVSGGAILTGGGALLRGAADAAAQVLELPVRMGLPHPDQVESDEKWLGMPYATAMGLLHYSGQTHWSGGPSRLAGRKRSIWTRRLSSWFEDLF